MHLNREPFEKILKGEKTVEIRLNDEKRRQIKTGDILCFYPIGDETGKTKITAEVSGLYIFSSFKELFASDLFPETGSGNASLEEAAQSMYAYYTEEQESQYGVLAIEIRMLP